MGWFVRLCAKLNEWYVTDAKKNVASTHVLSHTHTHTHTQMR